MKEGWKIVKLGEVCDFEGGSQPPKSEWTKEPCEGYVRMLQIRDFTQSRKADVEYVTISKKLRLCKANDILIGRYGASVGKILTGLEGAYNVAIIKSIPDETRIIKSYIRRFFEAPNFQSLLFKVCTQRAAQAGFSKEDSVDTEFSLHPLEEQHRIVSILDASFEKIDALKKNAEENLKNAKALFQQVLAQELKPKEGWVEKKLEEIVTETCSLSYGIVQPGDDVQNGIPVVRPVDFSNDIFVKREGLKRTKKEISDAYQRTILTGNEILMCVRGTTGTMGFATDELKGCNVTRGIVPILIDKTSVKRFVYYQLLSPLLQKQIAENTNGTALKQINIKDLRVLKLFMPSIEEQHRIVRTLDTLSEKCRRLEQVAQQTIRECDALKQSILRQAFSGEL